MIEKHNNDNLWKACRIDDGNLMKSIIGELEDGIYILDPERRIIYWNRAAEQMTGYKAEEIVGRYCQDNLLCHIDKQGQLLCLTGCPMDATLCDGKRRRAEVLLRHKDGYRVAVKVKTVPLFRDGEITASVQIFTQMGSVTDGYGELLNVLSERTMTDALTGLKNRSLMQSFLEHKLQEYRRFQRLFCVLFMDIDDFRDFNNTYGHDVGDELLKTVASNIMANLRGTDIVSRWGGEEFVGVYTIAGTGDALVVAEKIRALVEGSKILREGKHLHTTCSVGVAIVREKDTVESIVKRADAYMYRSKERGKNRVTVEGCGER